MSHATDESTQIQDPDQPTDSDQVREIGHDEFDPVGALALIGLYFLILVFLWFFMYFVEFLGNDPTVVSGIVSVVTGGVGLA
ncbi:hypothetical protein D8Y22_01150 [Salinadaptatus halalkaliphilus]|uniref:Cytochrome oxidase n=1 Tax=Salinadaptatus halalkaliphilus TaxID=2419781 RepID=A0A4S3TTD1_9EURY|nr:hypothetical protein [Salinadaptatus halalkaliphilus]THE66755.1 hypothetical protein D8Y22_01150 [Salinadaptatus halalkaliphilus]